METTIPILPGKITRTTSVASEFDEATSRLVFEGVTESKAGEATKDCPEENCVATPGYSCVVTGPLRRETWYVTCAVAGCKQAVEYLRSTAQPESSEAAAKEQGVG